MGWASGTEIAAEIEILLIKYVPADKLEEEAKKILKVLEDMDWDCQDEVEIFDYLWKKEAVQTPKDYEDDEEYFEQIKNDVEKYKEKFGF